MRRERMRRSTNVQDRRGPSRAAIGGVGGAGGVVLIILFILLGGNPMALLGGAGGGPGGGSIVAPGGSYTPSAEEQDAADLVARVLGDTEDVWGDLFRQMGRQYQEPTLVLFSGAVDSACGRAGASVGPFYCPADRTIYIDLSFFQDLSGQLGAAGDFAQAYVIAHEVGHHVQTILATVPRGSDRDQGADGHSVRVELQADYYAGVWAHHAQATRQILERGDIEEAIRAAAAVGDDRLQRQSRGYVVPDSFTHGTSEQRMRWFLAGYESGDLAGGDTFAVERP